MFFIEDEQDRMIWNEVWHENAYLKNSRAQNLKDYVVLDVGAHKGAFTALARCHRAKRVCAFEPTAKNFTALKRHRVLGDEGSVAVYNLALSDWRGNAKIRCSTVNSGGHSLSYYWNDGWDEYVRVAPLDDFYSEFATRYNPLFLKIDTEGEELKILIGATRTLLLRPELAIEIHSYELGLEVYKYLKDCGYKDLVPHTPPDQSGWILNANP